MRGNECRNEGGVPTPSTPNYVHFKPLWSMCRVELHATVGHTPHPIESKRYDRAKKAGRPHAVLESGELVPHLEQSIPGPTVGGGRDWGQEIGFALGGGSKETGWRGGR